MLSSATHKQDLWKSCHTAINTSILISERKAAAAVAAGKPITNPNDSLTLTDVHMNSNSSTMDEDNSSRHGGDETSTDDSDSEDFSKELAKAAELNKKKLLTKKKSVGRGRVGRPPKRPLNSKRYSKYKSDDSSDSSDFDDDLLSEDYDTDMETSGPGNTSNNQDDEEGYQNEIELIQNIENRLTNTKATTNANNGVESTIKTNSPSQKTPELKGTKSQRQKNTSSAGFNSNKSPKVAKIKEEDVYEYLEEGEKHVSSESSAAANIAAAMKKRLVVVASVDPDENDAGSEARKEAVSNDTIVSADSAGRAAINKQKQAAKKTHEKPKEKEKPKPRQSKTQESPKQVEADQSMNDSTASSSNRRQQPSRANKLKKYNG
jgi:hypothetical protein